MPTRRGSTRYAGSCAAARASNASTALRGVTLNQTLCYYVTMTERISVAEVKRRFADVLGAVRHKNERFVIERNGKPIAALVPLTELSDQPDEQRGFMSFVGAFSDAPEFPDVLSEAVESRQSQESRPGPGFTP